MPACAGAAPPERRLRAGVPDSRGPLRGPGGAKSGRSSLHPHVLFNFLTISPRLAWSEPHELEGLHMPACAGAAPPQRRLRAGTQDSSGPLRGPGGAKSVRSSLHPHVLFNFLTISSSSSDWCGRNIGVPIRTQNPPSGAPLRCVEVEPSCSDREKKPEREEPKLENEKPTTYLSLTFRSDSKY